MAGIYVVQRPWYSHTKTCLCMLDSCSLASFARIIASPFSFHGHRCKPAACVLPELSWRTLLENDDADLTARLAATDGVVGLLTPEQTTALKRFWEVRSSDSSWMFRRFTYLLTISMPCSKSSRWFDWKAWPDVDILD